jgi:4-aminobutyrate aminotransferase-like enzyme/Ser/Thr protein kinase RdoA (MazF antagonist)
MSFDSKHVVSLIHEHYGLDTSVTHLPGELDLNFHVKAKDGSSYIFKIANTKEVLANLELQNALINHLVNKNSGLTFSSLVRSKRGEEIIQLTDSHGSTRMARLLTWVEGRVFAEVSPHSPLLLQRLGEMCGNLCLSLIDFDHPAAHRFMKWDTQQTEWIKPHLNKFLGKQKILVDYFYLLFEKKALPVFPRLRKSVNYNDANDYNVLVSQDVKDPVVSGVIDFGDVVYTQTINELAIALAYAVMHKPDPMEAACHVVRGFNNKFKLTEEEISVLFPLMAARLIISVTCSELNRIDHPENVYLQISDKPAWTLLEKLSHVSPAFAEYAFRNACGLVPCPSEHLFENWVSGNFKKIISPVEETEKSCWLDLSVGTTDLGTMHDVLDDDLLNERILQLMRKAKADLAFGRYNEARAIYSTPAYAITANDGPQWRSVHIGLDFFCAPGTPVRAAYEGTVHSFANNNQDKDYGPTIILQHRISDDLTFYTLYGHLNVGSLQHLSVGKAINTGEVIALVGDRSENGNWPPHLHFQVILDMLNKQGDFPGVCTPEQRAIWKSICPDPWLLFTGKKSPEPKSLTRDEIVSFRKQHVGKNLSISYREPIKMVRGAGQYLIDDTGRRYLDTVNNVAHVGHEHPRVVEAGQRQMAVLNTNTRYLHENLVKFIETLLTTMPPKLNVVFMVNSGSEANELAMRLAKVCTGQKDMIVSQVGYHGNTNGCVEISSYKFDSRAGTGAAPHIHVVPIPDTYRGLYRANDLHAGSKYAMRVKQAIESMRAEKRKPAAMIFESVISCGGQVELPNGFLREAYQYVRSAGGVCIADEVQTGCGRAGDYYWAFQQHEVVPDIVTIGKPIGNGHPLGVVVTTQEIADAFNNGMEYFNTFGGNPVSCAIGLEVLNVIKVEGLQQNAKMVGDYLKNGLKALMNDFQIIGDVRGPGLFIGFELVKDRSSLEPATDQASYLANRMRDKGILMSTDGPFNNVLKIKPPMVFSKPNSDFLLESIASVLKEDYMKV